MGFTFGFGLNVMTQAHFGESGQMINPWATLGAWCQGAIIGGGMAAISFSGYSPG